MQDSPLAILQSANLYLYVMHNPVKWLDPWGLFAWNEADDHWFDLRYEVENAGGTFRGIPRSHAANISIWGVDLRFNDSMSGVEFRGGRMHVRADVFYSTLVNAAGGEMTFLGGHGAFGGTFNAPHVFIAIFASPNNAHYYNMFYQLDPEFTRWGLRFAYISGTGELGAMRVPPYTSIGMRTRGGINNNIYHDRPNLQFMNHLSSGIGMATQLFEGHSHFMRYHSNTFAWNGRWTNSTSFTIGLVNAMGLNHGLSAAQVRSTWGINNAFDARFFGR